ncbi:MAG: GNAT family N-acetyltransferase [bacterium]|nr:GNAT family N-acetyltransferase [bacterium]
MSVHVTPVAGKGDFEAFLQLPYRIYADDPNHVFPLLSELKDFFEKKKNPYWRHATHQLWLARRGDEIVGRVGACVDTAANEHHQEKVGYFGFFEVLEDAEVSRALLETAETWIREQGMEIMRGPGNYNSNHDAYGALVDGAWTRPVIGMPYNPRYYPELLDEFGLTKAKDLFAWLIETGGAFPEKMTRLIDRMAARPGLVVRQFDMKNFFEEASRVRELYNKSWSRNWGFVPLDDENFRYMAKDMKSMVDPAFLLVAEMDGEPIGFSLTIPDFNEALQPLKGRLLPFGWLKFLLGKRKVKMARCLLLGVLPEYRKLGVDMVMIFKTMQAGFARGITSGECSWILEDNVPMNKVLEGYGAKRYKTYRVYEKTV